MGFACGKEGCGARRAEIEGEPVPQGSTGFAPAGTLASYAPDTALSISHIEASLDFDFSAYRLKAKVDVTVENTLDSSVDSPLELNAVSFLDVSTTGEHLLSSDYLNAERIHLVWNKPFAAKEKRVVTVAYTIERPVSGLFWRKESQSTYVVTDHETERCRYWLPCIDFPTMRQTLTFHITAPSHFTALANGTLQSSSEQNGRKTSTWHLPQICPSYLICLAVGEFIEVSDGQVNGIDLKYYAPKGTAERDLWATFDKTKGMMTWLQEKVGLKFPWGKYYQICVYPAGGAMENISLVTFSELFLMDETLAKERKYLSDMVNLHEMAHTYFGDALVVRFFEHAWLKESWACYMESCWMEDTLLEEDFRYEMHDNAVAYIGETETYVRPIVCRTYASSWNMFDRHLYPGGAWRLHMLRKTIGDDVFWSAVRQYVNAHAFKEPVETHDFKKALERASGKNLTQFFDEWIYGKGFPQLKGTWSFDAKTGWASIGLEQTQVATEFGKVAEWGAPGTNGLFHITIDVEITTDKGKVVKSAIVFDHHAKAHVQLQLPAGSRPSHVRIDPGLKVLHTLDWSFLGQDILATTAKHAADINSRIHAYEALASKGTWDACEKIKEAIASESFWGVRIKVADAVAKQATRWSLDLLAHLIATEQHAHVHFSLFRAAKPHRDEAIRQAVLKRINDPKDIGYRGLGALYEVLGAQCNEEDLPLLEKALANDKLAGQHGMTRSGIVRGISAHRSEAAWQLLKKWTTKAALQKVGDHVAPALVSAVAGICTYLPPHLRQQTVLHLSPLLGEAPPPFGFLTENLIAAIVSAFATLGSTKANVLKPMMPRQDWPWLKKQMAKARETDGRDEQSTSSRVWKAVEQWDTKWKDVDERLGKVEKEQEKSAPSSEK